MKMSSKKAFTMLELVFVIVVIGILSAIAVPKFAATRDDATITKAMATIASVRSGLATERQKRILRGDFTAITSLNSTDAAKNAFDTFSADTNGTGTKANVLEYPVSNCTGLGKSRGCWSGSGTAYKYTMPSSVEVAFTLTNNRFNCETTEPNCILLTQ